MYSISTRCPKCHTSYNLTQEQLLVANGKVRCGQCQTVFQAVDNKPQAPQQPKPNVVPKPAAASPKPRSAFVGEDADEILAAFKDNDLIDDGDDKPQAAQDDLFFSEEFNNVLEEHGLADSHALPDDESWAEALLDDDDSSDDEPQHGSANASDDPFDVDLDSLGISLDLTEEEEQTIGAIASKDDLRGRISAEPLEFALIRGRSLWLNLAYGVLLLVFAGLLAAQLLYFQFDDLARSPQWRSLYANVCQPLNCQLPNPFDVSKIHASQLNVRTDPKYMDSLMVDTVIINQADKAQPFPDIELFFTNSQNEVVAARRFLPGDYLRGDLKQQSLMPANQPVHIALEISDPGSQAMGYWMQLSYQD